MEAIEFDTFIIKQACARCGYRWFPRSKDARRCPRCQSWHWRKEHGEVRETASVKGI